MTAPPDDWTLDQPQSILVLAQAAAKADISGLGEIWSISKKCRASLTPAIFIIAQCFKLQSLSTGTALSSTRSFVSDGVQMASLGKFGLWYDSTILNGDAAPAAAAA